MQSAMSLYGLFVNGDNVPQEERERELYERFQAEIDETGMLLALIMGGEYNPEDKTIKWNELNSYTEDPDLTDEDATEDYDPGDD